LQQLVTPKHSDFLRLNWQMPAASKGYFVFAKFAAARRTFGGTAPGAGSNHIFALFTACCSHHKNSGRRMGLDLVFPLHDTARMKYAGISFPSRDVAVRAFHDLARHGRIVSLPDGQFIVPEPAAAILQERGFPFRTPEWMSEDYVTQTPRNPAPRAV
jgi:hypothetical protein